jgi:hypothetical protein
MKGEEIMAMYEVIVGNIGLVYTGSNGFTANVVYGTYKRQSKEGRGRAAGEDVTALRDGEIFHEYTGYLNRR